MVLYVVYALRPFAMNFITVPGILVCICFLSRVCMFIVSKTLLIYIECYRDCSRRGSHLVYLFATVLFSVCCVAMFGMFAVM